MFLIAKDFGDFKANQLIFSVYVRFFCAFPQFFKVTLVICHLVYFKRLFHLHQFWLIIIRMCSFDKLRVS